MFIEDLFFFNLFLIIFYETIVFSTKHRVIGLVLDFEKIYMIFFFMKLQVRDQNPRRRK